MLIAQRKGSRSSKAEMRTGRNKALQKRQKLLSGVHEKADTRHNTYFKSSGIIDFFSKLAQHNRLCVTFHLHAALNHSLDHLPHKEHVKPPQPLSVKVAMLHHHLNPLLDLPTSLRQGFDSNQLSHYKPMTIVWHVCMDASTNSIPSLDFNR